MVRPSYLSLGCVFLIGVTAGCGHHGGTGGQLDARGDGFVPDAAAVHDAYAVASDGSGPDDGGGLVDAGGVHDGGAFDDAGGVHDAGADAAGATMDGGGADAGCWSCGLPSGTFTLAYPVSEDDCVITFVNGPSYPITANPEVVLSGTSPSALHVELRWWTDWEQTLCAGDVAPDGTWSCAEQSLYNHATASGRIDGLSATASLDYTEDDYHLVCPHLAGTAVSSM